MYSVTRCSEPIQCITYMVPADPLDAQRITILGNDTVYQRNTVPADPLGTCKVVESAKKGTRVGEIWMGYPSGRCRVNVPDPDGWGKTVGR